MTTYNPLISILIASYNASDYIEETLNSCINQTYKNIEIIVADDFSTDDTLEKIKQWHFNLVLSRPDIRCVILASVVNNGITVNFNNALQESTGEWIKCLGSDDILLPNALDEFINGLTKTSEPLKIGAVFTSFETFGEDIVKPDKYPLAWTKMVINKESGKIKKCLAMLHFNNVAPGAFINRKFIDKFDTNYKMLEDLPLWLKIIELNIGTLFLDFVSVKYRIHAGQITSSSNKKINNVLLNDLRRVNAYRRSNKYIFAVVHHGFNIYCSSKRSVIYKYLKVINPFNVVIHLYEILKK